jgi:hypothetical protein
MKNTLEQIKIPKQEKTIPYFSDGEFSMHQLIEHVIEQTGPAKMALSSFSITEVAVRTFQRLIENKQIQSLACLFDFTVRRHKLGLLFFANNIVTKIAIAKCHAKVIVIYNAKYYVTIISSANLNINDKLEAGIISTDREIFDKTFTQLKKSIDKAMQISKDEFN